MKIINHILSKKAGITLLVIFLLSAGYMIFSINKPNTFNDGDVITAEDMNQNFDALYAKVTELESMIIPKASSVPAGTIVAFGGDADNVPAGWLLCDGTPYSGNEYPGLYDAIGTNFGSTGGTIFNVPDLRGVFLRGVDGGRGYDPDRAIGSYQEDQLQSHKHLDAGHGHTDTGHRHNFDRRSDDDNRQLGTGQTADDGFDHTSTEIGYANITTGYAKISNPVESDQGQVRQGSETRPQNVAVNYIIKY